MKVKQKTRQTPTFKAKREVTKTGAQQTKRTQKNHQKSPKQAQVLTEVD